MIVGTTTHGYVVCLIINCSVTHQTSCSVTTYHVSPLSALLSLLTVPPHVLTIIPATPPPLPRPESPAAVLPTRTLFTHYHQAGPSAPSRYPSPTSLPPFSHPGPHLTISPPTRLRYTAATDSLRTEMEEAVMSLSQCYETALARLRAAPEPPPPPRPTCLIDSWLNWPM